MKTLVIGGTGKVGRLLVRDMLANGSDVRVLTKSAERAATLDKRLDPIVADIANDPLSSRKAFEGIDAVFMLNQPSFQETAEGLFAVELARAAGVRKFVYQSVFKVENLSYLPHVAAKLVIQRSVMRSGMGWTILSPNHFYQNDLLSRTDLLERSTYTVPVGMTGCSSVDAEDIAGAAFAVLTRDGHDEKNYSIVGPDVLTGVICAEVWAETLGRQVDYDGNVEHWREHLPPMMPKWLKFDLSLMYMDFGRRGFIATDAEVAGMRELLGREPTPYRDFALRQVAEWQS